MGTILRYHRGVNRKHHQTLQRTFAQPVRADVRWSEVETTLRALGATINVGAGSRVRVELNERDAVFHRPHPAPNIDKGALKAVRAFLESAGVKP
jgi:HicA toxin of bacterial toxin-antitoxin,